MPRLNKSSGGKCNSKCETDEHDNTRNATTGTKAVGTKATKKNPTQENWTTGVHCGNIGRQYLSTLDHRALWCGAAATTETSSYKHRIVTKNGFVCFCTSTERPIEQILLGWPWYIRVEQSCRFNGVSVLLVHGYGRNRQITGMWSHRYFRKDWHEPRKISGRSSSQNFRKTLRFHARFSDFTSPRILSVSSFLIEDVISSTSSRWET